MTNADSTTAEWDVTQYYGWCDMHNHLAYGVLVDLDPTHRHDGKHMVLCYAAADRIQAALNVAIREGCPDCGHKEEHPPETPELCPRLHIFRPSDQAAAP